MGVVLMLSISCKKEEKKIGKNWKLIKYEENGQQIAISGSICLNISSDGTYNTNASFFPTGGGTWSLSDDASHLLLFSDYGNTYEFSIAKLTNKVLTLYDEIDPSTGNWSNSYWEPY